MTTQTKFWKECSIIKKDIALKCHEKRYFCCCHFVYIFKDSFTLTNFLFISNILTLFFHDWLLMVHFMSTTSKICKLLILLPAKIGYVENHLISNNSLGTKSITMIFSKWLNVISTKETSCLIRGYLPLWCCCRTPCFT